MSYYVKAEFKCAECGNIFIADSNEMTSCSCGKCSASPNEFGFNYGRGQKMPEKIQNIEYYSEDFEFITDEEQKALDEVIKLGEELCYLKGYNDSFSETILTTKISTGERVPSDIFLEISYIVNKPNRPLATNKIEMVFDLKEKKNRHKLLEKIAKFKVVLEKFVNKEISLENVDDVEEKTKLDCFEYKKEFVYYENEFYI